NTRVAALAAEAARTAEELAASEAQCYEQRRGVKVLEEDVRTTANRMTVLQHQMNVAKGEHLEQMRQAARFQNDTVSFKAQVDNLRRERDRLHQKSTQAAEHRASLDLELEELTRAEEALQTRLDMARQALVDLRQEREHLRQKADETTQAIADLRA